MKRLGVVFVLIALPPIGLGVGWGGAAAAARTWQEPLPRVAPQSPQQAVAGFRVRGGFRMELIAAEPLVTDPVALDYDENGLAYVVEMTDYPYTDKSTDRPFVERTTDLPIGRVRVLEDSDGDGQFDRSTIFADSLSWPTGLAFWKGGVFVAATPDIWYLKDTDGDRRADLRRRVFTGFKKFNVQAVMNNLRWGLDQWIYGAGSSNGGLIRHVERPGQTPVELGRHDFRFDPLREAFELASGGARFGNTFDDWGNRFICNIRNPAQHVVLPEHYLARNRQLAVRSAIHDVAEAGDTLPIYRISPPEPWRLLNARRLANDATKASPRSEMVAAGYMTSACGITVYRGSAYPAEYYGNLFLAEPAANVVHRMTLEPRGVSFVARRGDERAEFVASPDNWCRPVNFANAPDGTLHVLDMYRETIEHPWSIPDDIKARIDLESGRDRGRIYRLAPGGFTPRPPPRLGRASLDRLLAELAHPDSWWRETAQRLLYERGDPAAVPRLREMLAARPTPLGATAHPAQRLRHSFARLHALWLLHGLGALSDADLAVALSDAEPAIRMHALQLAEGLLRRVPAHVLPLQADPDIRVRFQLALSLGELAEPPADVLARIAAQDPEDEWLQTAVLSSATQCSARLMESLLSDRAFSGSPAGRGVIRRVAQTIGVRNEPGEIGRVLRLITGRAGGQACTWDVAVGLAEGLRRVGRSLPNAPALGELLADAERTAPSAAPLEQRQRAIELLGYADWPRARNTLVPLLDIRQPAAIQAAAVRALAGFREPSLPELLIAHSGDCTPAARTEVIEALLARPDRVAALLEAIEQRRVATSQIAPGRRTPLLNHPDPAVRARAMRLFQQDAVRGRREVLAQYEAALGLARNPMRGKSVYERECRSCHRLGEQGHEVGPNLETVRHRAPEEILVQVLDPNREVAPNYQEYVVALADGRVISGIIAAEAANSITLRRAEGVQEIVLRQDIEQLTSSGHSLMPEGLEMRLTLQEVADLVAYLTAP
jgi:putative membrane-bound dehydrogenase-like protein